ncbi:MAG: hypothetical protein AAGK22_11825 [Acidobacteriota bacterium]
MLNSAEPLRRTTVIGGLVALCGLACHGGEGARSAEVAEPTSAIAAAATGLELATSPVAELYFLVRSQAAGVSEGLPELEPLVNAWLPVQEKVGAFGGYWRFDLAGLLATSPEEFADWFAEAPVTAPTRSGTEVPVQGPGLALAAAMADVWPWFLEEIWPARRSQHEEVLKQLARRFLPEHRRALAHMMESLRIEDPQTVVPMVLVLDAHPPGASTYFSREGPIAVLSTRELLSEGRFGDFEETLLHETCHALDSADRADGDIFSVLRQRLQEAGLEPRDRRLREVPHLVMFAQAEETMRRLFDSDHVAYGDTQRGEVAPLYERSGPAAEVVRSAWSAYLDEEIDFDAAVERIVAGTVR